ncbi:MAG: hypothetical protein PSV35_03930 [bacterium]|nr:hypothetical protein [bacterium]
MSYLRVLAGLVMCSFFFVSAQVAAGGGGLGGGGGLQSSTMNKAMKGLDANHHQGSSVKAHSKVNSSDKK